MITKNKMKRPRAILLDFYGTVVEESDVPITRICDRIAEACPGTVDSKEIGSNWWRIFGDMCFKSHGSSFQPEREVEIACLQELLLHFGAELDIGEVVQAFYKYWDEYWVQPAIFPESREVMANCDVPICLVSNVDNADLASALKHTELSFEMVVTSEDCRAYKPRPEPFEKALSLLGLTYGEALHVGDSFSSDIQGAKALGIPALWINRKGRQLPVDHEPPDYVSADLTGILDILSSF